jgi:sugar phosphate isomerase/epimerase
VASPTPYQFGISEFTTWPWSFEQDVETYAALGVDTIEACEFKLDEQRIAEQLALIAQHNLAVSSVQPVVRTLFPSQSQPQPTDLSQRLARFRQSVERIAPFAPNAPFVTNSGPPPKGNIQQVFDTAARDYRPLAAFAADHGVRVALEPLNAAIVNVETAVWTLQQAMRIVTAVDHPAFGICLDYWNIWQNARIEEEIRACGDRIFVVQLSDWRTPRSFQDRAIVGEGEIPLPPLLRATQESGYQGPYVVEIFSGDVPDSIWDRDLSEVIRQNRAGLDAAWRQAFPV